MLLSLVPLMWKPASQLQCWAWSTLAQRGRRLKAGSLVTLHSGGAGREERGGRGNLTFDLRPDLGLCNTGHIQMVRQRDRKTERHILTQTYTHTDRTDTY